MPNTTTSRLTVLLIVLVLGASCWLISAPQRDSPTVRPWAPDSILRSVVEVMALNYQFPTLHGVAIKSLSHHLGTVVALVIVTLAAFSASRRPRDAELDPPRPEEPGPVKPPAAPRRESLRELIDTAEEDLYRKRRARHAEKASRRWMLPAAQIAIVAFIGVQLLSALWSHAPKYTFYDAVLVTIELAWAVAIARCLTLRGALAGANALVVVVALAGAVGVWYHFERSPDVDLAFPIGNPLFLAIVLAPAMGLALCTAIGHLHATLRPSPPPAPGSGMIVLPGRWWIAVPLLLALVPLVWAFSMTHARSSQVALVAGAVVFVFLITRRLESGLRKLATAGTVLLVIAGAIGGAIWLSAQKDVAVGRSGDSLRGRFYYWNYAVEMFNESPILGHGRGTYPLLADSRSLKDRYEDPMAFFEASVVHAHNEWLQILAEGGFLSIGLMVVAYALTFLAAVRALQFDESPARARWVLVGLLTALAVMLVEECADNALRVEDVPPVFYTLLGLTWALIAGLDRADRSRVASVPAPRGHAVPVRLVGLVGGLAAATAAFNFSVLDWWGARELFGVQAAFQGYAPEEGIRRAPFAARNRLDSWRRLEADKSALAASVHTTEYYLVQAQQRIEAAQAEAQQRTERTFLAGADLFYAHEELGRAMRFAEQLNQIAPGVAGVTHSRWRLGDLALRITREMQLHSPRLEALRAVHGVTKDARWVIDTVGRSATTLTDQFQTHQRLTIESLEQVVRRDPFSEESALWLWRLTPTRPIDDQIRLFMTVLRGGGIGPGFLPYLAQLSSRSGFTQTFEPMLVQARRTPGPDEVQPGLDPIRGSALRMGALLAEQQGRLDEAVGLASAATGLFGPRFVAGRAATLFELARMQFAADPANPEPAVESVRQAMDVLRPLNLVETSFAQFREMLILYELAADHEEIAKSELTLLTGRTDPALLDRGIGEFYGRLALRFLAIPEEQRPPAFARCVERAMARAADSPIVLELRFRQAVIAGRGAEATALLDAILNATRDPTLIDGLLGYALEQLPADKSLLAYAAARSVITEPPPANPPTPAPLLIPGNGSPP